MKIPSFIRPACFERRQSENLRHIPWADEYTSLPIYWPDVVVLLVAIAGFLIWIF